MSPRATVLLLTTVVVLGFVYWLRAIFLPLFVALLTAYTVNPIVEALQRWKLPRWGAVTALFLTLFSVLLLVALITVTQVHGLVTALRGEGFVDLNHNRLYDPNTGETFSDDNLNGTYDPGYQQIAIGWARENSGVLLDKIYALFGVEASQVAVEDLPKQLVGAAGDSVGSIASIAGDVAAWMVSSTTGFLTGFINLASLFFLFPVYTFFFLLELPRIWSTIKDHLPGRHRTRLLRVGLEIHGAISLFLRGRIWIALIKGILTAIGLSLLGVKFSFLIGMAAGVASILPFVGPVVGFIPSALILFFDSYRVLPLLFLLGVFVVVELIEGYLLYPWLLGKDLDLHPLTLIVSLFVGGAILGLAGVLLAVPAVCAIKIIAREYVLPHLQTLAKERGPAH